MEEFVSHNPTKLILGKDTIGKIGCNIKRYGYKKILLLAGGGSIKKTGVYDQVTKSLKKHGISWTEVWDIRVNPVLKKVREGIRIAREHKCEAILAVGGGSVIDSAKAIAAGMYVKDVWEIYEGKLQIEKAMSLFVVLTISATSSEMNGASVLTNEEEKKKWSLKSIHVNPKVAIIDPSVQQNLPWNQTVNGAIDALSHIMENYFVAKDQLTMMNMDEALMRTLIELTDKLKDNPKDYDLRANFCWAITLAHNGFSASTLEGGDWSSHKIEHAISALHPHVAHAQGLAIVFPAWIKHVHKENLPTFKRWSKNVWNSGSVDEAIKYMKAKYKSWGAPISLKDIDFQMDEKEELARVILLKPVGGTVKDINEKDVKDIIELMY